MYNEKKKASNLKHMEKLVQINIKPGREEGEAIKKAAFAAGEKTQRYILNAVRERMKKEGFFVDND